MTSTIELACRVKRDRKEVFDATISIPVKPGTKPEEVSAVVATWLSMMDQALALIPKTDEVAA